ncbi:MAG: aromatic ring-hydroxylating dioxygenase subunit alpha [Phenylobacterium sp.]|uniref:aromatic ring-hydroxylating oxygenase subunit alpha n=1 Tax=Phenylobacterium sp. TaxID=1871053 RepID=UPI001A4C1B35|nr:aromatic ring-hydroxylating dioxygenase subunit alpha [Phenylobacterium sp.]MBL8552898.1 aromatic ring-hydroxylating dioxygenase subunit alpha [Phenylobacterium sp.]
MADGTAHPASWDRAEIQALFDSTTGWLDRRVLSDEGLYQLELERIFARSWNFMCHESQLKAPGDYVVSYIGEDQLIVVRDEEGEVHALLNTCRHRGNALCRAEQGHAKSFVCSYHGWNYGLDGRLIGVPGLSTFYHGDLDKSRLGLAKARIESHLGFYFATLAPDAPSLHDFLGVTGRTGLAMVCANGEVEVVEGVQKNVIDCNWKIAVDNLFDWYHVPYSHASANTAGFFDIARIQFPKSQMVMLGEYGHAIGGPVIPREVQDQIDGLSDAQRGEMSRAQPEGSPRIRPKSATDLMGPEGVRSQGHPNIFPNLWVTISGTQMCLRLPRGPSHTELWWFTLVPKAAPPQAKREIVRRMNHVFGPAGLLEQDDGENWSQSTRSARGVASRGLGQALSMGLGRDEVRVGAGGEHYVEGLIGEHGQRWLYRAWTEWMSARDWAELEATRSAPPTGLI